MEPAFRFRVWDRRSSHTGDRLTETEKDDILSSPEKFDLLICGEETLTRVFMGGFESGPPPGRQVCRILAYVLKNRGSGGTAWNIAQHVCHSRDPQLARAKEQASKGPFLVHLVRLKPEALGVDLVCGIGSCVGWTKPFSTSFAGCGGEDLEGVTYNTLQARLPTGFTFPFSVEDSAGSC